MAFFTASLEKLSSASVSAEVVDECMQLKTLIQQASSLLKEHEVLAVAALTVGETAANAKLAFQSHQLNEAALLYTTSGEIGEFEKCWGSIEEREDWLDGPLTAVAAKILESLLERVTKYLSAPETVTEELEAESNSMMELAKQVVEVCVMHLLSNLSSVTEQRRANVPCHVARHMLLCVCVRVSVWVFLRH